MRTALLVVRNDPLGYMQLSETDFVQCQEFYRMMNAIFTEDSDVPVITIGTRRRRPHDLHQKPPHSSKVTVSLVPPRYGLLDLTF